jgi:hypothetical protein
MQLGSGIILGHIPKYGFANRPGFVISPKEVIRCCSPVHAIYLMQISIPDEGIKHGY